MRNLLLFMFLIGVFVLGFRNCSIGSHGLNFGMGVDGQGNVNTEVRDIKDFEKIDMAIDGELELTMGSTFLVEVSAEENLLPLLKTEAKNGVLDIYFDKNIGSHKPIKVRVTLPALKGVSIAGSGKVTTMTPFQGEDLVLDVSGSGDMFFSQVNYASIQCDVAGSGQMNLSGQCTDLKIEVAGSGDIKAKELSAANLDADIAGSGSAVCTVSQKLKASVAGSGDVIYYGTPSVDIDIAGSGKVKQGN